MLQANMKLQMALILGSLDINEIEQLIKETKILGKNRLLDEAIMSATEHKPIKTPPIASN